MMRLLLLFTLFLSPCLSFGQTCEPDSTFADSTAGVYPRPYDPELSPNGGITECAYIGEFFQFDFTIVVRDSLVYPPFELPLTSVVVSEILGLPEGLAYACVPAGCTFPKATMGCASIYGTPTANNTIKDYDLTIKGTVNLPVFPFVFPITFPDANLAPGKYTIKLKASTTDPCDAVGTKETLSDKVALSLTPNPASEIVNVNIHAKLNGTFYLAVHDVLGKVVHRQRIEILNGDNTIPFHTGGLANGFYAIVLQNENGSIASKLTIQH